MAAATKLPKHSMGTIATRMSDVASSSKGDKLAEAQVNTLRQEFSASHLWKSFSDIFQRGMDKASPLWNIECELRALPVPM